MMTADDIAQGQCESLLLYLDREEAFLREVEQVTLTLAHHPPGRPLNAGVVEEISSLVRSAARQAADRTRIRAEMAALCDVAPDELRMSRIRSGSDDTLKLHERRRQILRLALTVSAGLQSVLMQLRESGLVVRAILESLPGITVHCSGYDREGRPVQSVRSAVALRVA